MKQFSSPPSPSSSLSGDCHACCSNHVSDLTSNPTNQLTHTNLHGTSLKDSAVVRPLKQVQPTQTKALQAIIAEELSLFNMPQRIVDKNQSYSCQDASPWIGPDETFLPRGFPSGALHEIVLSEKSTSLSNYPLRFIIAALENNYRALHNTFHQAPNLEEERRRENTVQKQSAPRIITIWIGRDVWPTPYALPSPLKEHALFLDPQSPKELLWALDAATRSRAVLAVTASCEKLSFNLSQRFAYATRMSGACAIFLRPSCARYQPSAAPFRWSITPTIDYETLTNESLNHTSLSNAPQSSDLLHRDSLKLHHLPRVTMSWNVALLKAKQSLPDRNNWTVHYHCKNYENETISLRVSSGLVSTSSKTIENYRQIKFG